jgi:hypothetical protein
MLVNWGVPVNIPEPPGVGVQLLPWQELKFNPVGLFNLRRHLGALPCKPGVFTTYQEHFLASDIAWFAAGLSEDGDHHTAMDTFHRLFSTLHENVPSGSVGQLLHKELQTNIRNLTFDLVNLYKSYIHHISLTIYWYRPHCGTTSLVVV